MKFGSIFLPELSQDPLGVGDDRCSSCPGGGGQSPPLDAQLCLECSDPHGPPQPTPMCTRLSAERRAARDEKPNVTLL